MSNKSIKGTFWSMVERFSTMGIQLLCTLVVAQFLPPSEFGLIGMMSIFMAFSTILVDAGFGQAIIREQNVTPVDYSSIFYFNILLGLFIYSIFFFCAPLIARFYNEPRLVLLIRIAFLSLLLLSFSVVQQAQLFKSVNFATVSKSSLCAAIISGFLAIVIAYLFRNVWALVVQSLSFAFIRTCLLWIFNGWRPQMSFAMNSIRKYIGFSMNLLASNLIASITDNLANLFIGKHYSAHILGNYTIPDKLQRSVAGTLSFSIHRVSYPIMSSFQNDDNRLREYSQKVVGIAFYVIAPVMIILGIEADDFFAIILSSEWSESASYFKYMCIIGGIYCFADINMDILLVKGKSNWVLRIEIIRKTMLVLSLVLGIMYDIKILLLLLICYNVFNAIFVSYWAGRAIRCSLIYQLRVNLKTIMSLCIMIVVMFLITHLLTPGIWRFCISVTAGISTYLLISYFMQNTFYKYLIDLFFNKIQLLCRKVNH